MTTELERDLRTMFLRREEDVVTESIQVPQSMKGRIRMARLSYVALGVVLVGAAALATTTLVERAGGQDKTIAPAGEPSEMVPQDVVGNAPERDELVGTWTVASQDMAVRFSNDGTVAFANTPERLDSPESSGTFEIEGSRVTFGGGCLDGLVWETGIILGYNPLDDALEASFIEGACGIPTGTFWNLTRVQT